MKRFLGILVTLILIGVIFKMGWFCNPIASPTGRIATRLVAASNASDYMRAQADYRCDGTNDEVLIQRALDSLGLIGGNVVLSEGIFTLRGTLKIDNYRNLLGASRATILRLADFVNANMIETPVGYNVSIRLANFYIDGNKVNNNTGHGIYMRGYTAILEGLTIFNAPQDGIHTFAGIDNFFSNMYVSGSGRDNFFIEGGTDQQWANINSHAAGRYDVHLRVGNQKFVNLHTSGATQASVYIQDTDSIGFANSIFENNLQDGIRIQAINGWVGPIRITNCQFTDNGKSLVNTYDAVHIDIAVGQALFQLIMQGNSFTGTNHRYDIFNATGRDRGSLIMANLIGGGQTGRIGGTWNDTKIRNNDGYLTETSGTIIIPNAATSIVVNHGLSVTPSARNISITPTNNPTNDPGNIWVDTITATQFTIHSRNDPGATGLNLSWQVVVL